MLRVDGKPYLLVRQRGPRPDVDAPPSLRVDELQLCAYTVFLQESVQVHPEFVRIPFRVVMDVAVQPEACRVLRQEHADGVEQQVAVAQGTDAQVAVQAVLRSGVEAQACRVVGNAHVFQDAAHGVVASGVEV